MQEAASAQESEFAQVVLGEGARVPSVREDVESFGSLMQEVLDHVQDRDSHLSQLVAACKSPNEYCRPTAESVWRGLRRRVNDRAAGPDAWPGNVA
mmetsp:Transcript_59612/g.129591  ORF Transcript_59612/g.129591 Transcript_59612/m.129591 type:complete len:96 (+) Transcript_59612:51-338(+)